MSNPSRSSACSLILVLHHGFSALHFRAEICCNYSASRLWHRHDLQQMAVWILEVKAPSTAAGVELPVRVVVRATAVRDPVGLHAAEDPFQLLVAHVKGVVMAVARPGVEARTAPPFLLVGKVEGQVLVHLHLREISVSRLH